MNVEDSRGKLTNKEGAEKAHEACQADNLNSSSLKLANDQSVIGLAITVTFGRDRNRFVTPSLRQLKTGRLRAIGHDQNDSGRDVSRFNRVGKRQKIRSATAEQNRDILHEYRTSPVPAPISPIR